MLMSIMGFVAYASLALMVVIIMYSVFSLSSEFDDIENDIADDEIREAYERMVERDAEIFREVIDNE